MNTDAKLVAFWGVVALATPFAVIWAERAWIARRNRAHRSRGYVR